MSDHAWNLTKSAIYVNEILSTLMLHIRAGLDLTLDGMSGSQLAELDLQLLQVGFKMSKDVKSGPYKLIDVDVESSDKTPHN